MGERHITDNTSARRNQGRFDIFEVAITDFDDDALRAAMRGIIAVLHAVC